MLFSNIIERLLGDPVKIRVFRVLAHHPDGMSGRGIASLIRTSPFKINQVLRELVEEAIVESAAVGRANLYRLNRRHVLVQEVILKLVNYEDVFLKNLGKRILKRLSPKPVSVILYGSVSRGQEMPKSDLDIHLVYENMRPRPEVRSLEEQDALLSEWVVRSYGNPLSISHSTISDFQNRSKMRDPLIRNIVKEGRVLAGLSLTEILGHGREKA